MKATTLIPPKAEALRASGQALQDAHDMQAALGILVVDYLDSDRGGMKNGSVIEGIQQLQTVISTKLQSGLRLLSPKHASEDASLLGPAPSNFNNAQAMLTALLELLAVQVVKALPKSAGSDDLDCGLVALNSAALSEMQQADEAFCVQADAATALLRRIYEGEKVPKAEFAAVLNGGGN